MSDASASDRWLDDFFDVLLYGKKSHIIIQIFESIQALGVLIEGSPKINKLERKLTFSL